MKLISKTLLWYLGISLPLLIIGGLLSYRSISNELKDAIDESLKKEELHVEKALAKKIMPENLSGTGLYQVDSVSTNLVGLRFSDVLEFDSLENEQVKYRVITSFFNYEGQNYQIRIAKPSMEEEELKEGLLSSFGILAAFLLFGFFIVNLILSRTLWKPFYITLEKLKNYELKNHVPENFAKSSTIEFKNLNIALNQMTHKIHSDFLQQKEFTENASHEMQTPLAIIKANVSLLMQSSHIQLEEMNQIQAIDDTTKKLSSLNKALLLLAKIDNNQFKETSLVDMRSVVEKVLMHFEELLDAKQILLQSDWHGFINVSMNPTLADILITNLFQNAIQHNYNEGHIKIELNDNELVISNTGKALNINEADLFTRFKKSETSNDSIELGLAIVKSICTLYDIDIQYIHQNAMHHFILRFNKLNS